MIGKCSRAPASRKGTASDLGQYSSLYETRGLGHSAFFSDEPFFSVLVLASM